jgi:arylsulfatase A-like enzyme
VSTLERAGELDNTVIAYTSDNGHMWGEHKIVNKTWAYEPSIKVPLIIRTPAISASRTDDRLIVNLDLPATFLDLAGVRPPIRQDGRSLVPILRGEDPQWRTGVRIEYRGDRENEYFSPKYQALRTARYKLIVYDDGERELYDLELDPNELINLADVPGAEAIERELLDRLRDLAG